MESLTFSGVIYNVLKSVPGIYCPLPNIYSPIELKLEGGSFTGFTVAVKVTVVVSTPPPSTPPSSFTVTVIVALPYWFSNGFKANCCGNDSTTSIAENKSVLSDIAEIVTFCGFTSEPYPTPVKVREY